MGKGQSSSFKNQTQTVWASTRNALQHNRTLWLAGALAFFVPSVAASAWYAGSTVGMNNSGTSVTSESASADTQATSASSAAGNGEATAQASANGVTAQAGTSSGSTTQPKAEVTVNGKKVDVPPSGVVNQTTINSDGSTSQVNVSVNANQGGSSNTNGFSSTYVNSNSSTNTNSNNTNTNSSTFFNSYTSSP